MNVKKRKSLCATRRHGDRVIYTPKQPMKILLDGHDRKLDIYHVVIIDNGGFVAMAEYIIYYGQKKNKKNTHFYDLKGKKIA